MTEGDPSNGWDAVTEQFAALRSSIGAATVHHWAQQLPANASVLDVGCGTGRPISETLHSLGVDVHGIDPSPNMVAAFRQNLPTVPVACEPAETSPFFHRTFDGIVTVGVLFLLTARDQERALQRMASALNPTGRLLFSAPRDACTWIDTLTGRPSVSLGLQTYRDLLETFGTELCDTYTDEGGNHYYAAQSGTKR